MNSAILTIDDISSRNTPAMVDYLKEHNIIAVMFGVGENIERYYDNAVYALKNGMIVGNHTYSHPKMSELDYDRCIDEIEKCERVLDKLYADANVERKYRPFRFPFGDKGGDKAEALQQYLKDNGFNKLSDAKIDYPWWEENHCDKNIDTFWTFDFAEYCIRPGSDFTKEDVYKRMYDINPKEGAALFGEDNNHIILLHAHDETEELVPEYYKQFIDELLEKNMVFDIPEFI